VPASDTPAAKPRDTPARHSDTPSAKPCDTPAALVKTPPRLGFQIDGPRWLAYGRLAD